MKEKDLLNQIMLFYTQNGHRLFRQNVGLGWTGQFIKPPMQTQVTLRPQDVLIRDARPLHAGLCKGSSDLIGWTKKQITKDMVGKTVAIFTAIEGKTGNLKTTEEQERFIKNVIAAGGEAKVVRSIFDIQTSGESND